MNSAVFSSADLSSQHECDPRSIVEIDSAAARSRALEALARRLASDFPLHSMSELRRVIAEAEDDLWPRKDPTDVIDRARERLREGLAG